MACLTNALTILYAQPDDSIAYTTWLTPLTYTNAAPRRPNGMLTALTLQLALRKRIYTGDVALRTSPPAERCWHLTWHLRNDWNVERV